MLEEADEDKLLDIVADIDKWLDSEDGLDVAIELLHDIKERLIAIIN